MPASWLGIPKRKYDRCVRKVTAELIKRGRKGRYKGRSARSSAHAICTNALRRDY